MASMVDSSFIAEGLHASYQTIRTPYGNLAVYFTLPESSPSFPLQTILFIHGNSFHSLNFKDFFNSKLREKYRLIAFDLPGHGASSNAAPVDNADAYPAEKVYGLPEYGHAATAVMDAFGVDQFVIFGWSMGGHIAIEMLEQLNPERLRGIIISGTPPTSKGQLQVGFAVPLEGSAACKDELIASEIDAFARAANGTAYEPWMTEAVSRTHGKARALMYPRWRDESDQKGIVERNIAIQIALVNGASDPFINHDFIKHEVKFRNLWKGKVHALDGLGHAPFAEAPETYVDILEEFVGDCEARA